MLKSLSLLVTFSIVISIHAQAQIGQADPQSTFPTSDSLVLISAEYLAQLIRGQKNDEMVESESLSDLEDALRDLENAKLVEAGLRIYPDVTADNLQLELSYDKDYVITLFNRENDAVIRLEDAFGSNQLNLHDLAAGTYRLQLETGDETYRKRIEKE